MNFEYQTEAIKADSFTLEYFIVPWDTAIVGQPVAEISRLEVADAREAVDVYTAFTDWCEEKKVTLCHCRIFHDRLTESMFLQERGFRFIELNYRPRLKGLCSMTLARDELNVEIATEKDSDLLAEMAARTFLHGRFHEDPRLGSSLGNRRYRVWMVNSFNHPRQKVLKCLRDGKIVGFFVVEYPEPEHCFWSLVGLAPGLQGKGLGKRVWNTLLRWHQSEGIDTITTSISSHNIAVFNLYVSMGFRFGEPLVSFHWRPPGAPSIS